ncbi:MAG TPA: CFI-box-CTERM domain-containing protein, partial [Polyangiales bacterium]|nr:CFI-box-CTERM domain-containing protein [Polyangiales bacterium]
GRREGVLPIWAHRRLTGDGAEPFKRVIFQNRTYEGLASRTSEDFSRDDYFCLSFNNSRSKKDALDAVSCASVFNSDKGRFITDADVQGGYAEPYEDVVSHVGRMQPLDTDSFYPPRRDIKTCAGASGCYESADVGNYDASARAVMPDIDAVSMATLTGDQMAQRLFAVPNDWQIGSYRACLEINVEGDYNANYNDTSFPTPTTPAIAWDSWATGFGYPYRGQPSVVYCVPFELQATSDAEYTTDVAEGSVASWDTAASVYGALQGMDGMTSDPVNAPGSGGDRLKAASDGSRFKVIVKPPMSCDGNQPPSSVDALTVSRYANKLRAWEYATLSFKAASDDTGIFRYDVRVSTDPMVDDASFMRGQAAKSATTAADELRVSADASPGTEIRADFGGLIADTHYYVGVRAIDGCAATGPISVAEITTTSRVFATVSPSPCFVATAAYGTPMAAEITALRRFRDRHLANNVLGRLFVHAYGIVGPKLADFIRGSEALRAVSRALLAPAVAAARSVDD